MGNGAASVLFRVDAGARIGSGHVMRCLALAAALRELGAASLFVCRAQPGHLADLIAAEGHAVHLLAEAAADANCLGVDGDVDARQTLQAIGGRRFDWLVVDHYGIDVAWERALRPGCRRILVIDDLADRAHDCDVLLDQNVYADARERYSCLVPPHCERLIGPGFSLLREEFVAARAALRPRRFAAPLRLHVFFGGSDPTGETLRTLRCLSPEVAARFATIDVVVGAQNAARERIAAVVARMSNARLAVQVSDIARHVAEADMGIGACGSAALERCSLGLPTLSLVTAANQVELARGLAHRGAIELLGDAASVGDDALADAVAGCLREPARLRDISAAALALFPGDMSGARRLATRMAAS